MEKFVTAPSCRQKERGGEGSERGYRRMHACHGEEVYGGETVAFSGRSRRDQRKKRQQRAAQHFRVAKVSRELTWPAGFLLGLGTTPRHL